MYTRHIPEYGTLFFLLSSRARGKNFIGFIEFKPPLSLRSLYFVLIYQCVLLTASTYMIIMLNKLTNSVA